MAALDFEALKSYVRDGPTGSSALAAPNDGDTVSLLVTHSHLKRQFIDRKFSLSSTVERVKEQLQVHTGTAVSAMQLQLFSASGNSSETDTLLYSGLEDFRPLGYYSPQNGYRLHVIDTDPTSAAASGWLEDTSLVEKYSISEEDYEKRDDSVRRFKQQLYTARPDLAPQPGFSEDFMSDIASTMKVGDRCEVDPGGKRGTVAFVGTVDVLPKGFWVGVKFDEPVGVNDGSVEGKKVFDCERNYGSFLRPDKVKVGDYPERDPFDDDEPDEF
ncbi:hypothetical protein CLOM_g16683 [Closterium sp. NIES-68]|nr:hypothetical protein CLOM_g16683 [Closterium sp. NIES-68]GJP82803.1 hypothetical protein CLOP_g13032 [Closterium sp. NIES-67]